MNLISFSLVKSKEMTDFFLRVLQDRNQDTLSYRLEQLELIGFDPTEHKIAHPLVRRYAFPIELVLLCLGEPISHSEELYLEQVLLWVAERTTPDKTLIEIYGHKHLKGLEEVLKRYTGETIPFRLPLSKNSVDYWEMLLGYSLVKLDVAFSFPLKWSWKMESVDYEMLPIELTILIFALNGQLFDKQLLELIRVMRRHGSPEPCSKKLLLVAEKSPYKEYLPQRIQKVLSWVKENEENFSSC